MKERAAYVLLALWSRGVRWWKVARVLGEMLLFYVKVAPFGLRMYHAYYLAPDRTRDALLDLAYGPLPRNRLDYYPRPTGGAAVPAKRLTGDGGDEVEDPAGERLMSSSSSSSSSWSEDERPAPLVVFIHGGAWSSGGKHQYGTLARALQRRGFAVAVANYTLHPAGSVQQMVRDLALMFKFIEREAASLGFDAKRVHVVGHSAGAHLLALYLIRLAMITQHGEELGLSEHYQTHLDASHLLSDIQIQSFVGIGGPYHIADHYRHESMRGVEHLSAMKPTMGGIPNFDHHSPTALLDQHDLDPMLLPQIHLLHGTTDGTVPISSSIKFADTLKNKGHNVELHLVDGIGHADFILHLMNDRSSKHEERLAHLVSLLLSETESELEQQ